MLCSVALLSLGQSNWELDSAWYKSKNAVSDEKIDLFYILSTEVVSAQNANGTVSYRAVLSPTEKKAMDAEFAYVEQNYGQGDVNFVAPYYHQFTFDACQLSKANFDATYKAVSAEVCEAFDYYMQHRNNGRRFVIAGFSQGAMLVLDLLRHMTDEQYQQMVAAYAIGYRVSEADMQHQHIRPAIGETDTGVTVSFNSVLSTDGIWPLVTADAATCINPVNWHTDATPATFNYDGHQHTVSVDTTRNVLLVTSDNADAYRKWNSNPIFKKAGVSPNCLHHFDLLFYTNYIHDNILKRTQNQKAMDKFTTKSGKTVTFTAIKHGSIEINYNGIEIEVDPVTKLPPVTDYTTMPKADFILVTHKHFDHCDKVAVDALTKDGTVLIANPNSAKILGKGTVMVNGDKQQLAPDITIEAVPAYNTSPEKQNFHPKGRDNGYVLTIDGLRIYIAGDTEPIEEMKALKDIDVAFLPCNLPFTMTPQQLAEAAKMFTPKVLFPYHYGETKIEEAVELLKNTGIDLRIRNYQ